MRTKLSTRNLPAYNSRLDTLFPAFTCSSRGNVALQHPLIAAAIIPSRGCSRPHASNRKFISTVTRDALKRLPLSSRRIFHAISILSLSISPPSPTPLREISARMARTWEERYSRRWGFSSKCYIRGIICQRNEFQKLMTNFDSFDFLTLNLLFGEIFW